ncbi:MAG: fructosamine kinase family protein [Woeseiaceae bacterium]
MVEEFVKTGPESAIAMFEAEAEGLAEIRKTNAIRVPEVIDVGVVDGKSFIRLEQLRFSRTTDAVESALGEQLARLHRTTSDRFGWHRDNTIGATPQHNDQTSDWIDFYREKRLRFQLDLAARNGYNVELQELGTELCDRLAALFDGYQPVASLLHGDLWGGNWGNVGGEPVLFDPAVYYGDRESDIAMTTLFGGFGPSFYAAYKAAWPLQEGFEQRQKLYTLYHVLNHLNLFGRGYEDQSIRQLLELTRIV